jgi:ribonuclease VapC
MHEYVLDASALLALLNAEKGAELVQDMLPEAILSTVNLAEVVTRLAAAGMPENEVRDTLTLLGLEVIPFDEEQAYQAGLLYSSGREYGLSLGDRSCLALARTMTATAVTADRSWGDLELGIGIKLIR